jgi:uncharacterized protein (TIGR02246 family)
MFERFTEKARRVIFFARYETSGYGARCIETEHLLLGLIREDRPLLNRLLKPPASAASLEQSVRESLAKGERISTSIEIPLSEECRRILLYSSEEAERLAQKHISTEHLLLGMLREGNCQAAKYLRAVGLILQELRPRMVPERLASKLEDSEQPLHELESTWNSNDPSAFSRLFAEDAELVDCNGSSWKGRNRLSTALETLRVSLSEKITVDASATQVSLRDEATAYVRTTLREASADQPLAQMTLILGQQMGRWIIMLMHLTEIRSVGPT